MINRLHQLPSLLFLLVVMGLSATAVQACSCMTSGPPCQAYWKADVIFSGTAKTAKEIPATSTVWQRLSIRFAIESTYKGRIPGTEVEVRTGTGGGDCGYHFEGGQQYLVYAWANEDGTLSTNICSRTRPLSEANEDLQYFRNIPHPNSGANIQVKVVRYEVPLQETGELKVLPLKKIKITAVKDNQNFEGTTDENGKVELSGLPPGTYKVTADISSSPNSYYTTEVELTDRGCAGVEFYERIDGSVSGRVVDGNGNALNGARLDLLPLIDSTQETSTGRWGFTNNSGEYFLRNVPPGSYILGVNLLAKPNDGCPVPKALYINPQSPRAGYLEIKNGEELKGIDIQLPPAGVEREISGEVVWPDGKPAKFVVVKQFSSSATTPVLINGQTVVDENGRFSLRGSEGCSYRIYAFTYGGRLDTSSDAIQPMAHAEPVTIKFSSDQPFIKFVLSEKGFIHADDEKRVPLKP